MRKIKVKHIINFLAIIVMAVSSVSCEDVPELAETPHIEFNNVRFAPGVVVGPNVPSDTLVISIDFEDGNGDLGLDDADVDDPIFQEFFFVSKSGQLLTSYIESEVIFFGEPNQPPYNSDDWYAQFDYTGDTIIDTVRVQYNENFHNIFVDFYYRTDMNGDGDSDDDVDYMLIDTKEIFELEYDARFMLLNQSDNERPLRGTLSYTIESRFRLSPIFRDNTLKIEVQIQDRALNRSNIVSSPDFVMEFE